MSTITAETILKLIAQLPPGERTRLNQMLAQQTADPVKAKAPLDQRVPCEPMPDRTREWDWIEKHREEYAGHWVALVGDQLVAASTVQQEVFDKLKTVTSVRPLIHRIPSPDDLPYIGI